MFTPTSSTSGQEHVEAAATTMLSRSNNYGRKRSDLLPHHDGSAINDASAALVGNNLARTDFAQRFSRQPDNSPRTTEQSSTAGAPSSSQRYQLSATSFSAADGRCTLQTIAENEALRATRLAARRVSCRLAIAILTTSVGASSSYHQGQSPLRRRTDVTMGEDELRTPRTRVSRHQVGSFCHHGKANKHKHYEDKLGPQTSSHLRSYTTKICSSDHFNQSGGMKVPALLVPKLKGRLSTGTHDITPPVRNAWAYTVHYTTNSLRRKQRASPTR